MTYVKRKLLFQFRDTKVSLNSTYDTSIYNLKFDKNRCINVSSIFLIENGWLFVETDNGSGTTLFAATDNQPFALKTLMAYMFIFHEL